ncbi:MAG: cyclodeaminase/cyclohydrolase family protein [Planctomycetota bacterium]|jgi:formiminotetrahydrofolate cyclodeaminase
MSADKQYLSLPMKEFLDDLSAKSPTPGGGSVAAVAGTLAAAQARMVVEYTIGKKRYAEHQKRLTEVIEEFKRAGDMFGQLMSEDMAAYERLAAAYKAGDNNELEKAVATATAVPMEIVFLACAVVARTDEIKAFVNQNLLCDLRVAAIMAYASARSASTAVRVNMENMTDRKEAARLENQLDMVLGRTARHRNAVVHYRML